MNRSALIVFSLLFSSCVEHSNVDDIDWNASAKLPNENNLDHIGVAGPVTGIIDNKLIIAGGANFPEAMPWNGGAKKYQKNVYLYDLNADGELNFLGRQDFNDSLAYSANISLADQIISVGGERNGQAVSDVFSYGFEGNSLVRKSLPQLPLPLTNAGAVHISDKLYVAGGENADLVSDKIFVLDLNDLDLGWKEFASLPKPLSHLVLVTDNKNNLFVVGGRKRNLNAKSDISNDVYQLDVNTNAQTVLASLPEQLAAGTGVYYQGNILLFGGDNGSTFHQVEHLIADINTTTDEERKQNLIVTKNKIQESHPGFSKQVLKLNLKDNIWTSLNEIKGESPVTTTALLYNNAIIIPSGEVRAGVRTNQILIGKLN